MKIEALIQKVVTEVKSKGIVDKFRRECMEDLDTRVRHKQELSREQYNNTIN